MALIGYLPFQPQNFMPTHDNFITEKKLRGQWVSATSKPTNSKDAFTYRKKIQIFFCKSISKNKTKPHKKPQMNQKVPSPPFFKLK